MADKGKTAKNSGRGTGDIERDTKINPPTLEYAKSVARERGDKGTVENIRKIQSQPRNYRYDMAPFPEYKRGGKVRKSGRAKLHKGELVVSKRTRRRSNGRD